MFQVDFQDFSLVHEWRSPAIANKRPQKTLAKPFISEEWRDTVVKAYHVLKQWGETNVVCQPGDTTNAEGDAVVEQQPTEPPNIPVSPASNTLFLFGIPAHLIS
jgi:hypothetical protein